ncbi:MAG: hypothetical protein Q7R41_12010, partial [Phycisphaerales bacterium]|nr:hypothetical protein [Phycisphaerales bacterium]
AYDRIGRSAARYLSRRRSVAYTPGVDSRPWVAETVDTRPGKESVMFERIVGAVFFFGLLFLLSLDFLVATA